jgi:DNA-binding LacI/PurR family transcriptional regulator
MATLDEVARRAGVSRTTVSYVLNNRRRRDGTIGEDTRRRVLEAASALGYQRNELARAVLAGKAPILTILSDDEDLGVKANIIAGAMEAATREDHLVKLLSRPHNVVDSAIVNSCVKWRVSGVLALNVDRASLDAHYAEFVDRGIPLVMVDNVPSRPWAARVVSDDGQGIRLAVEHLIGLGHQRIAFLNGPLWNSLERWRDASFRLVLMEHGLPVDEELFASAPWADLPAMEEAARRLLALPDRPTAVVCSSTGMAISTQKAARAAGLRLPDDLSVTGYADSGVSLYADPPLTSVAQPFKEMGRVAARHLIALARDPDALGASVPRDTLLPNQLVVRGSTAPARAPL